VIRERVVLLRIEDLEERRRRVAPEVVPDLAAKDSPPHIS